MNRQLKILNAAFISLVCFLLLASNNFAQISSANKSLSAAIPLKARTLLKSGQKLVIEQDKINEGLAQIKQAINLAPNFVTAHSEYVRIRTYWLDQAADVQAEYEALMKKEPGNPVYPLALAQGLQFAPRMTKNVWFAKASELAPEWSWGHFAKSRASELTNAELALSEMLKAVEKEPNETQFYVAAIPMLTRRKRLDEASSLYEKLPAETEAAAKMNLLWDLQLAREGNGAQAIEKLNAELARILETSRDVNALKAVRVRYRRLKNEDKLKETEAKIAALDPAWYPEQGEIAFTTIFDESLKRLYFAGRQNLIDRKFKDVDYEKDALEQIGEIEALLALKPNAVNLKFIRRRLLVLAVQIKDTTRAVKYGEALLAADPNDVSTLARLAVVYAEKKRDLRKAEQYSARAMELSKEFRPIQRPADMDEKAFNSILPESRQKATYHELRSIILNSRAFVLTESGKASEGEILLRQSLELQPTEEAYAQLGKTLRGLGRIEEADKAAAEGESFWRNKIKADFKNEPLKDFELTTIKGEKIKLSALKGKVVMLNYWATWCVPCIKEMPLFVEIYNKYKAQGLEILAVSVDSMDDRPKVPPYVEKTGITFPVIYDENSAAAYGVHSYPTTIFIDREGNVRYRALGLDAHNARRNLEFILSELLADKS